MNLRYDRYKDLGLFKSDPNAELPQSSPVKSPFLNSVGVPIGMNGKCWDDSEVSDEEMDALIDE